VLLEMQTRRIASTLGMVSGALAGVVCVSAVAGYASPIVAMLLGALGSAVGFLGAVWMRRAFHYDDSLDIFALHALPALAGLCAAGFIVPEASANLALQLGLPILLLCIGVTVGYLSAALLRAANLLRVPFDEEDAGLDLTTHGETVHPPQSTL
jgi:ammonium transporter, Amt family